MALNSRYIHYYYFFFSLWKGPADLGQPHIKGVKWNPGLWSQSWLKFSLWCVPFSLCWVDPSWTHASHSISTCWVSGWRRGRLANSHPGGGNNMLMTMTLICIVFLVLGFSRPGHSLAALYGSFIYSSRSILWGGHDDALLRDQNIEIYPDIPWW